MNVGNALARGQRAAEARMIDACVIERATGTSVDEYGNEVTTYETVYEGKCRVMSWAVATTSPDVGQQRMDLLRFYVHVPVSATGVRVNDRVHVTSSRDPELTEIDRFFRVENLAHKTDQTARRLPVEEIVS